MDNCSISYWTLRLSEISIGYFLPQNVTQHQSDDENVVWLNFNLNNQSYRLCAKYNIVDVGFGEAILPDLEIIKKINSLITNSGVSFEIYERICGKNDVPDEYMPFNSTVYILALSNNEKDLILKERGWHF